MWTPRISIAALEIGRRHEHLPVEAAGTEQSRVEVLKPVGRAHDDDLGAGRESVKLDEQLVQRLVLLAVEPVARARCADRVQLVDEHDRRRMLARLVEQLPDARGPEAREHLDEGRRALRVEGRAGLVGDGLGQQRLPRARRAVEEDPLRDARAELLEALRVAEEVDDLLQLFLHLLQAGDVRPGNRDVERVSAREVDTRGVSFTTRHRKYTMRHMRTSGSHRSRTWRYLVEQIAHDARIGIPRRKP